MPSHKAQNQTHLLSILLFLKQFQVTRPQFTYVVKKSRTGKQGRKYIPLGKSLSEAPVVLRKPVKKAASTKTVGEPKLAKVKVPTTTSVASTKLTKVPRSPSAKVLPGNVGRRGKRGARLADELAMSNSDNEIPETQASRKATMCNKEPLDTKSIQSENKDNDKVHVRRGGTLDAYTLPVGTPAPISKSRPQRRKRSMEERLPDFLMEVSQVLKSVHQARAAEFYILCNIS